MPRALTDNRPCRIAAAPRREGHPHPRRLPQAAGSDRIHPRQRAAEGRSRYRRGRAARAFRTRLLARPRPARKPAAGARQASARRKGWLHAPMTSIIWDEAPIAKRHDRAAFDCGDPDLNLYLQKYARQNHDSGGAKCFVAAPVRHAGAHSWLLHALAPHRLNMRGRPLSREGLGSLQRACVSPGPPRGRSNVTTPRARRGSPASCGRPLHPRRLRMSAASHC